MARRKPAAKATESKAAPVAEPSAPEREDPIAGPRALAFSQRVASPAEYLRALLVVAVIMHDKG